MTRYVYLASSRLAQKVEGTLEAKDEVEAISIVRSMGLQPIDVKMDRGTSRIWAFVNKDIALGPEISASLRNTLALIWGNLISCGLSVDEALKVSMNDDMPKKAAVIVNDIRKRIEQGTSLKNSLEMYPASFPSEFIGAVEAGEATGRLGPVLTDLAKHLQERDRQASELVSALVYPAILFLSLVGAVFALTDFVIPSIEQLFAGKSTASLPLVTQFVFGASHFLRQAGPLLAIAAASSVVISIFLWIYPKTRRWLDALLLKLPIVGRMLKAQLVGRFLRDLALLLGSGVAADRALEIASRGVPNRAMHENLAAARRLVVAGRPFAEALSQGNLIGPEVLAVIRAGEQSGRLNIMAQNAADAQSTIARSRMQLLSRSIVPVATIVSGVVVSMLVYAVMTTLLAVNEAAFQ